MSNKANPGHIILGIISVLVLIAIAVLLIINIPFLSAIFKLILGAGLCLLTYGIILFIASLFK